MDSPRRETHRRDPRHGRAGTRAGGRPGPAATLPVRGPRVHTLGVPLPPARMPLVRDRRPLKRWRYVGVYTAELMLCVGEAHVGGLPQRWWALALPDGTLLERTTLSRGGVRLTPSRVSVDARARRGPRVSIELELGETPAGRGRLAARPLLHLDGQAGPGARSRPGAHRGRPGRTGAPPIQF